MSFLEYKEVIEEGDTVILYVNFNVMYPVVVTEKKKAKNGEMVEHILQTNYGGLKVKDLIGHRFGTKVWLTRGYAYALYPTPELWTKILPHRTQILYATDIAMILTQLELKPGSVVIESGTGSGSLSHSFARTIAPNGHLHTFDFHKQRVEIATQEFKDHKMIDVVTAHHGDACQEGFGDLVDIADAVFLDLPHPWEAIGHAKRSLKKSGGRLCSFSPCIEQVQKASNMMRQEGFKEITTIECLLREFHVKKISQTVFDPARESKEVIESRKRKHDDDENGDESEAKDTDQSNDDKAEDISEDKSEDKPEDKFEEKTEDKAPKKNGPTKSEEITFVTGVPMIDMPGHTGYLTFATLPPTKREQTEKESA